MLKALPADEQAAAVVGLMSPLPGGTVLVPAGYRGAKHLVQKSSSELAIRKAIKEMNIEDVLAAKASKSLAQHGKLEPTAKNIGKPSPDARPHPLREYSSMKKSAAKKILVASLRERLAA